MVLCLPPYKLPEPRFIHPIVLCAALWQFQIVLTVDVSLMYHPQVGHLPLIRERAVAEIGRQDGLRIRW